MSQTAAVIPGPTLQSGRDNNKLRPEDSCIHDWYRFILSFPPHLVRDYVQRFGLDSGKVVLDPFCGTGTTPVECKKLGIGWCLNSVKTLPGIAGIGIEANSMPCYARRVKTDWNVGRSDVLHHAEEVAERASASLERDAFVKMRAGVFEATKPKLIGV